MQSRWAKWSDKFDIIIMKNWTRVSGLDPTRNRYGIVGSKSTPCNQITTPWTRRVSDSNFYPLKFSSLYIGLLRVRWDNFRLSSLFTLFTGSIYVWVLCICVYPYGNPMYSNWSHCFWSALLCDFVDMRKDGFDNNRRNYHIIKNCERVSFAGFVWT